VVPLRCRSKPENGGAQRKNEMEWEEAYYRRQAARARRVAEGATTKAVKARLLDGADHYDELAAKADRTGAEAEKS
jgi:hypothetical protein